MAYDEGLAHRIREVLEEASGFNEKKMFGGIAFLLHGNMVCGVIGEALMARVGPQQYQEALKTPHTRVFDMTGKVMKGWVVVEPEGIAEDEALHHWIGLGKEYALSLPAK